MSDDSTVNSQPLRNENIIVAQLDNPNLKITTSLFNGQNFLAWSQSVTLFLKGRGKMGYINGRIKTPKIEDAAYDKWEMENSVVMTWLIHSMIPDIGEGFLDMATAQDIWETMAKTYSRKGNSAQIFELRRVIGRSEQGEMCLFKYFSSISTSWKRLDHLLDYKPVCPTDSTAYNKLVAEERIFKFLEGLNSEYDPVRSRVLGMDPLPSLQEAFAYVQNEESRRSTMLPLASAERSALVSVPQKNKFTGESGSSDKSKQFCDYCNTKYHTRETCYKIHGYPPGSRGGRFGQSRGRGGNFGGRGGNSGGRGGNHANHTEVVDLPVDDPPPSSSNTLSSSELETLRRLMTRLDTSTASSSFASGNLATSVSAFNSHTSLPWIIDSGASDHMTGSSPVFCAYTPCSGRDKVRIADGTVSSVSGKGLVRVTPLLSLSSV